MSMFVLQTILLLVVAFVLGSLLGRLFKGMFCSRGANVEPAVISSSNYDGDSGIHRSYVSSADKLANRDRI